VQNRSSHDYFLSFWLQSQETADPTIGGDPVETGTGRTSSTSGGGRSVKRMDLRDDIREFLGSRRERISPDRAGLPAYGGNRRVKGLRREVRMRDRS
jgi:hypothetical protein